MATSWRKIRDALVVVGLLVVPLLLVVSFLRTPERLGPFDRAIRRITVPLEAGVSYATRMVGAFFERWILQAKLQEENAVLRGQMRELEREVRSLRALAEENEELRRALQMREKATEDLLVAERVGIEQSPHFRVIGIRIDRGRGQVREDMPVISADGVVGRIDRVYDDYSEVMLVTDPRSRVAVELPRTRAQGILFGVGEDLCEVSVPEEFDVREGDLVQTSGVDDIFPKGQPVGAVTAIEVRPDGTKHLEVSPFVAFDRAFVMWVVLAPAPAADPLAERPPADPPAAGFSAVE
ncbi:MAG: rod shape-determining protein MreC [Deltaproteobacteria bacterium]|nr:MAG: rod shape-determining protein MreC [Deltaproteobacteria bacterium]